MKKLLLDGFFIFFVKLDQEDTQNQNHENKKQVK